MARAWLIAAVLLAVSAVGSPSSFCRPGLGAAPGVFMSQRAPGERWQVRNSMRQAELGAAVDAHASPCIMRDAVGARIRVLMESGALVHTEGGGRLVRRCGQRRGLLVQTCSPFTAPASHAAGTPQDLQTLLPGCELQPLLALHKLGPTCKQEQPIEPLSSILLIGDSVDTQTIS